MAASLSFLVFVLSISFSIVDLAILSDPKNDPTVATKGQFCSHQIFILFNAEHIAISNFDFSSSRITQRKTKSIHIGTQSYQTPNVSDVT
jgi:hypothetical protein